MTQQTMFETEDLPLFSGTAQRAEVEAFSPRPESRQETWAQCKLCLDTGFVQGEKRFCICPIGQAVRAQHQAKGEGDNPTPRRYLV